MRGRSSSQSIVASPVLVGAVTVLVALVAVLLAVNANSGLPFVPTYDVRAEVPGGSNLTKGNDVRIGGFQVGIVENIRPAVDPKGKQRAIAVLDLKLSKDIEPIPEDTRVLIRPRSVLGLKYVDLQPNTEGLRQLKPGATIPIENSQKPIEIDEFFSTFDEDFRNNQRRALRGFGDAFAGRGPNINIAIQQLVPFVTHLEPVARTLADPETRLARFFQGGRQLASKIAPVADTYAQLFTNMGTTFEALSRSPESLRDTIERGAPTLRTAIDAFPTQRAFLADAEILFREFQPVADEFDRSLPTVADALRVGTPVNKKIPAYYRRVEGALDGLRDTASNPNTLLALNDLGATLRVAAPLVNYIAPYQTVCNYWNYYWHGISEHVSEPVRGGTVQRSVGKTGNRSQDNRVDASDGERPADIAAELDPVGAKDPAGDALQTAHAGAYESAIDAQGNADCQVGQRGYVNRLAPNSRYGPNEDGGQHVAVHGDIPGLSGPTFTGVKNLKDVP
ncbi:MAG: MCE family protein [Thermoleophilaceae bacterium]|nr:MCE family protein [Thermoleophilaceae bacterium]